MAVSLDAVDVS